MIRVEGKGKRSSNALNCSHVSPRRPHDRVLGLVLALVGVQPALAQDEPRVSLSTSVDYSVGDYGTGKDTTLVYVPFTLGVRPFDRFWLSVTVPFLYQHGQNVVITGGGVASRKGQKGKFAQPAQTKTEEGLGDVLLKAYFSHSGHVAGPLSQPGEGCTPLDYPAGLGLDPAGPATQLAVVWPTFGIGEGQSRLTKEDDRVIGQLNVGIVVQTEEKALIGRIPDHAKPEGSCDRDGWQLHEA